MRSSPRPAFRSKKANGLEQHRQSDARLARAGAFDLRLPAVLLGRRPLGRVRDGNLGADAERSRRSAHRLRSRILARARVPVWLPERGRRRLSADGGAELDGEVADRGLAARRIVRALDRRPDRCCGVCCCLADGRDRSGPCLSRRSGRSGRARDRPRPKLAQPDRADDARRDDPRQRGVPLGGRPRRRCGAGCRTAPRARRGHHDDRGDRRPDHTFLYAQLVGQAAKPGPADAADAAVRQAGAPPPCSGAVALGRGTRRLCNRAGLGAGWHPAPLAAVALDRPSHRSRASGSGPPCRLCVRSTWRRGGRNGNLAAGRVCSGSRAARLDGWCSWVDDAGCDDARDPRPYRPRPQRGYGHRLYLPDAGRRGTGAEFWQSRWQSTRRRSTSFRVLHGSPRSAASR